MQRIVDWFMPNNCRKQFNIAVAKNRATCLDTLCVLRGHQADIVREMRKEKAA